MLTRTVRIFAAAAATACLVAVTHAATPSFWQISTQPELLKGEVDNLSIDSDGRIVPGPVTRLVHETTAPFLWALTSGPDGSMFAGSGNDGKIFRIDRDGKGSVLYDSAELEVHALAMAPDGTLYAGSSPDGRIYKIDAKGVAKPFFDPEDKYIWALAVDAQGTLYAATGEKGIIYRITQDGKGEVFYRTKATNVVALRFDPAGNLLAATEAPGKLFRIDRQGKGFVLLDSPYREIHAIRLDAHGTIYAAAMNAKGAGEGPERPAGAERPSGETTGTTPVASVSAEITSIAIADVTVSPQSESRAGKQEDRRTTKGAVYRVLPEGGSDVVWDSKDDRPYDLAFDASGGLLIATGDGGKIFRVFGEPSKVTLLTRLGGQQVTSFLPDGKGGFFASTANPGKIFDVAGTRVTEGSYTSAVRDAETVATWGTISWRGSAPPGTGIELFTRAGNTEVPDETWSPWAGPYSHPDGSAITSPRARYLQWRAVLKSTNGAQPALTSVTAAYLQRNLRPRLTSITVEPPGLVFQRPFSSGELEIAGYGDTTEAKLPAFSMPLGPATTTVSSGPPLGRRLYQKGLQTFIWKAEDDNDDKLQYDVMYRREGETTWRPLKKGLSDPLYVWDTTSVPDGTYMIKVIASDAPSNVASAALTGELESDSFDVDNVAPTITITGTRREGNRVVVRFDVKDDQSPIDRVEYSINADRWVAIYPVDGIADSQFEQYEITVDNEASLAGLVLRAEDSMHNGATMAAGGKTGK